jgi:hypothetical protein
VIQQYKKLSNWLARAAGAVSVASSPDEGAVAHALSNTCSVTEASGMFSSCLDRCSSGWQAMHIKAGTAVQPCSWLAAGGLRAELVAAT